MLSISLGEQLSLGKTFSVSPPAEGKTDSSTELWILHSVPPSLAFPLPEGPLSAWT
jgi:hypothetical protein